MREYEFTFVVQPEISEEGLEAVCQRFESTLDRTGAEKLFYDDWGRKRLAYEIRNFQKGHYMILHYLDTGSAVPELERVARLDDSILRFLTVLADENVQDLEARRGEAVSLEEDRRRKAAERAVREAEEAAARAAEAEEAAARAAAHQADADAKEVEADASENAAQAEKVEADASENAAQAEKVEADASENAVQADAEPNQPAQQDEAPPPAAAEPAGDAEEAKERPA